MIKSFKHIFELIIFIFTIIKYRLYPLPINTNHNLSNFGRVLNFILSPIQLLLKPKLSYGLRLYLMLQRRGPIYIKFGQVLSTRPDLVGEDIADNLKSLQDRMPPFSGELATSMLEQALGRKTEDMFAIFNIEPIAAASIAQVHQAVTKNGSIVAVKILRPNIVRQYQQDIDFLYFLVSIIERLSVKSKRLKLKEVVKIFDESMKIELDLRFEAAACSELKEKFSNDKDIYIPQVYWDLTAGSIVTTEWIDGISIYNREELLKQGLNPQEIAAKVAIMFFNQVYRDGYFHADMHPGNIFVLPNGKVSLIDFGIMGRLPAKDRIAVAEILYGFLKRDYLQVAKTHIKAGYIPKQTNVELFAQACRSIGEPLVGLEVRQISISNLLGQLFKITEDFSMETQSQLILLQKTMVVIEGIGKRLDPNINMWLLAEEWIKKWALKNLTPEAKLLKYIKHHIESLIDEAY